jgi:hypothetical protein
MKTNQELAPLVKGVWVPTSPQRAFDLFTGELSAWWPLRTHRLGTSPRRRRGPGRLRLRLGLRARLLRDPRPIVGGWRTHRSIRAQ